DAAGAAGQGRYRRFLQFGVDRRLHRRAFFGFRGRDRARGAVAADRVQGPAGLAGEADVERLLEAADPNRRFGGEAVTGEARGFFFGRGADFADDVDRGAAERVFAFVGGSLGQRRAVVGEDRRPLRQFDVGFEVLALGEAGEDEARVPGDAAVGEG